MNTDLQGAVNYHYGQFPPQSLNYAAFIRPLLAATDAIARYDQMVQNAPNSEIFLASMRSQEAVISSRMDGAVSTMEELFRYQVDNAVDAELHSQLRHKAEADAGLNSPVRHMTDNTPGDGFHPHARYMAGRHAADDGFHPHARYQAGYAAEVGNHPHTRQEVIETFVYLRALSNAQRTVESGQPLSPSMLKTMHRQLLSCGRWTRHVPGEVKLRQNYLADKHRQRILFVPISPEKLQDGLEVLFQYLESNEHSVLLKTALASLEFEALRPFEDGNGRIGRMLVTLMLWHFGAVAQPHFYISSYFEDHKGRHVDTLRRVSEQGAWDEWCNFFFTAVHEQASRNLAIAAAISALYDQMKAEFSRLLASKWSQNAVDFVFTNPVFRNSTLTRKAGIPAPTAARFTRVLLRRGLLDILVATSGRRPALYSFAPLMDLVRV